MEFSTGMIHTDDIADLWDAIADARWRNHDGNGAHQAWHNASCYRNRSLMSVGVPAHNRYAADKKLRALKEAEEKKKKK